VSEDPVGHLYTLVPTRFVRGTEMNTVVDADIDHIGCHVREATIGAGFLRGLRVIAANCECSIVLPEEQRERADQRRRNVVGTGSIFGIWRGIQKGLPRSVAGRRWIAVVLALLDGRDRSPIDIVFFAVPSCDGGIGHRQIGQSEQTRIFVDVVDMRGCDLAEGAAQLEGESPA
jgi:hypothetical protein